MKTQHYNRFEVFGDLCDHECDEWECDLDDQPVASSPEPTYANRLFRFMRASVCGCIDDVKVLLGMKNWGQTQMELALQSAAKHNHLDCVKLLVENGCLVGTGDGRCASALTLAAMGGHLAIVKYLVEHGANVRAKFCDSLVVACAGGYLQVAAYLIEQGAYVYACYNKPIRRASQEGHLEVAKYLVGMGADPFDADDGVCAYDAAKRKGHRTIVRYFDSIRNSTRTL